MAVNSGAEDGRHMPEQAWRQAMSLPQERAWPQQPSTQHAQTRLPNEGWCKVPARTLAGAQAAQELCAKLLAKGSFSYAPRVDREAARRRLAGDGLPARRAEAWKYSNVQKWYQAALLPGRAAPAHQIRPPEGVEFCRFEDPAAAALLAAHLGTAVDLDRHPLAAVNRILLDGGMVLRVPAGRKIAEAVRFGDLGAAYEHVLIILEPGAELAMVETPAAATHRIVECIVGAGARLTHRRVQPQGHAAQCGLIAAKVEAAAHYSLWLAARGTELRRNDIHVTLAGRAAEAHLHGAWRLGEREHLDNQVTVDHLAPDCLSRQTFRGVVGGRARAVLNGRIHIAAGAQASDASLTTKSLLESTDAEVYAKPELEIYANDVRCSHGATIGALDEAMLFYCESRGIDRAAARRLLLRGFLREAISGEEGLGLLAAGLADADEAPAAVATTAGDVQ